ncbi:hypothetical protein Poli38472_011898 [Pythium oligandrum]|uniref:Bacterial Pleckstrin homology domain-containing protein n=1 Tax=Pythium oligandrum TaxID=41045 RepID=A0A8K1C8N2_PYTOL|nr:hypothetical protein Poli38472_011898 [Pythium oligandrum]|eukprot:TMW58310.1 hypothetical protein Poli38472_011898 [Pythium oligandrum]
MLKSLAADLSGSADVCRPVHDLSKCIAAAYLIPTETIHFALQSSKEEFTFTNQALIVAEGENATTTRKLVTRYEYKHLNISKVKFETAGHVDRDCEIKFQFGSTSISIDITKDEIATATIYYKVIELISRAQLKNDKRWELAKSAMGHAAEALYLKGSNGETLTQQSDAAMAWLEAQYTRYNPHCYRDVILQAFQDVQGADKLAYAQ